MITEKEIINQIKNNVIAVLNSTGLIRILKVRENTSSGTTLQVPDLSIEVQTNGRSKYTLFFEVKSTGQPRFARIAMNQLKELVSKNSNYYGVFASSFISEESRKICQENKIGFIDIGGNCFFKFDNVYLSIEGKPNLFPNTRPLKTLFYSKSSRALRVLLCNPSKNWFLKDLSKEADISIGQAFLVKKKLLEEEFIEEFQIDDQKKFKLTKPDKLLVEWEKNYSYKKNNIRNYYSLDDIKTIESNIANYCNTKKIKYAFTLTSGASLVAPFLRYNRAFAYILDDIETFAKDLNFKEVSSGSNISILQPYDEGVFYNLQVIDGVKVVSDIQLYLDLISYKERGEEAAKFLYEQRISKSW
ncbi:MAG: type IV toxin-antitoxin system AbiEi family antitoxin [Candidatus Humimicrobiaceae bacterium]